MATTANYNFKKHDFGYPVRDDELGDNSDLIDTAIKARETEIDVVIVQKISSDPPTGKKRIINMYYNPSTGLPELEVET